MEAKLRFFFQQLYKLSEPEFAHVSSWVLRMTLPAIPQGFKWDR